MREEKKQQKGVLLLMRAKGHFSSYTGRARRMKTSLGTKLVLYSCVLFFALQYSTRYVLVLALVRYKNILSSTTPFYTSLPLTTRSQDTFDRRITTVEKGKKTFCSVLDTTTGTITKLYTTRHLNLNCFESLA